MGKFSLAVELGLEQKTEMSAESASPRQAQVEY
jgi:hypothetical protein